MKTVKSGSSFLKLISLNIEGDKHIPDVLAFLKREKPEVVCLQEVYLQDFEFFKKELGMKGEHALMIKKPLYTKKDTGVPFPYGICLLNKYPFQQFRQSYYHGNAASVPELQKEDPNKEYGVLLYGTLEKENVKFTIGTTHFTWTPNGQADERQREHLSALLKILKGIPEIVFCGDFNAPRGRKIFAKIAQQYIDHIPKKYATSINKDVHQKGGLQLMVDGLFSTPHYKTRNVRLVKAGSDHLAITAEIARQTIKRQTKGPLRRGL